MIYTKEFNFESNDDYVFSYEILKKRYSSINTLIKGITPSALPSFDEHKNNIKNNFLVYRIGYIDSTPIGLGYIDKNNYVGFFYNFKNLKPFLKLKSFKGIDFSEFFLRDVLSHASKGTVLFARVSRNNTLANKTANRLMTYCSSTSAYNMFTYNNE